MPRALWNGEVVAESDDTVVVEGNHYFPRDAVRAEYLRDSGKHTLCSWKGRASYFSLAAGGELALDSVWHYPRPLPFARKIRGYVAFGSAVTVEEK